MFDGSILEVGGPHTLGLSVSMSFGGPKVVRRLDRPCGRRSRLWQKVRAPRGERASGREGLIRPQKPVVACVVHAGRRLGRARVCNQKGELSCRRGVAVWASRIPARRQPTRSGFRARGAAGAHSFSKTDRLRPSGHGFGRQDTVSAVRTRFRPSGHGFGRQDEPAHQRVRG
jgi:hypothetical protein